MQSAAPEVSPAITAYPLAAVLERFPAGYFTNTIAYMIGLAIALGAEEIGIYGVDMALGSEYGHQRPSCEYLIGLARGMGIRVHVPATCDLLKTPYLYAFGQADAWTVRMEAKRRELVARMAGFERAKQDAQGMATGLAGAVDLLDWILRNSGGTIGGDHASPNLG
jgi:hypothetical protein